MQTHAVTGALAATLTAQVMLAADGQGAGRRARAPGGLLHDFMQGGQERMLEQTRNAC